MVGQLIEERSTALNMGIGSNGGLTPILQHKTKPGSGQGLTCSLAKIRYLQALKF